MDEDAFDYAISSIEMLEVAAIAYELGHENILSDLSACDFNRDDEYEFATNGMNGLCDFMGENYNQDNDTVTMYFSSNDMMDYYRLCREHSKLKNIPLKENPYMRRAESAVREQMFQDGCCYCCYRLQTKVNHRWASGIVFEYDANYFWEYLALFSRLLYVFAFYTETVKELRARVEEMKQQNAALPFPPNGDDERSAA